MVRGTLFGAVLIGAAALSFGLTDLTFFAVSDVHVGQSSPSKDSCRAAMPGWLNGLAGQHYPASVGGGVIDKPRGLLMPGDLIDQGSTALWSQYILDYDPKGTGRVKIPAYEGLGNHEYYGTATVAPAALRQRNQNRIGVTYRDATNLHYSWDWDAVHFVMLNVFSGAAASGGIDPYGSYAFLEKDLADNVGASGRPVLVMQHFPMPDTGWWPMADANKMGTLLKKYNCIGILHGHSHAKTYYKFQGMDVYDDGTVMNGDISVFRITEGKMFVVNRIGDNWGSLVVQKNISMGSPTGLARAPAGPGPRGDFAFYVDGVGKLWSGNRKVSEVEIADLSGRTVRRLRPLFPELAWDRRDDSGRDAAPGLYVVRLRTDLGALELKLALR
jgi:hypothetical protein